MMEVNVKLTGRAADNVRDLINRGFAADENEALNVAILCYKYCKIDKTPEKCPIVMKIREKKKNLSKF